MTTTGATSTMASVRPWLGTFCRLIVGAVFVWAGLVKLLFTTPAGIESAVAELLMWPQALTSVVAKTLPWLELMLGVALLVNRPRKVAAWVAVGLMGIFTVLLVRAALTGAAPDGCACFGPGTSGSIHLDIARNLMLTALAARAAV